MAHKTLDELRDMLAVAQAQVTVGAEYHHYKDTIKTYRVTGLSILEATDEVAVRYAMADNPDVEFVRALSIWLDKVEWNGQTVSRFSPID